MAVLGLGAAVCVGLSGSLVERAPETCLPGGQRSPWGRIQTETEHTLKKTARHDKFESVGVPQSSTRGND